MSVKTEIRELEARAASLDAVQRLATRVQFESLAKAEQLRKLTLEYRRVFASPAGARAMVTLFDFLDTLTTPFHKPLPDRDMKKIKAYLDGKPAKPSAKKSAAARVKKKGE